MPDARAADVSERTHEIVDYHSVSMTHEAVSVGAARHPICPGCTGSAFRPYATKGAYRFLRCETCGLLAVDPMPGETEIAEHYRAKFHGGNYAAIRAFAGDVPPAERRPLPECVPAAAHLRAALPRDDRRRAEERSD